MPETITPPEAILAELIDACETVQTLSVLPVVEYTKPANLFNHLQTGAVTESIVTHVTDKPCTVIHVLVRTLCKVTTYTDEEMRKIVIIAKIIKKTRPHKHIKEQMDILIKHFGS